MVFIDHYPKQLTMFKKILLAIGILVIIVAAYLGYLMLTTKNHSPEAVAEYNSGDLHIQVDYCQPYKKDRLIFGTKSDDALVPFGEKWRTGANEATEISFSEDVTIGGQTLEAGRYSLYTIPDASSWTVVFNSKLEYWGAQLSGDPFDETLDVLRVPASVETGMPDQEQFTISFTEADSQINMHFDWADTRATLGIERAE